jgi:hypothetical protein
MNKSRKNKKNRIMKRLKKKVKRKLFKLRIARSRRIK